MMIEVLYLMNIWGFFIDSTQILQEFKIWCSANIDKTTAYLYMSHSYNNCFHICRVKISHILLDLLGLICTTLILPKTALYGDQVGPASIDLIWGGQIKI